MDLFEEFEGISNPHGMVLHVHGDAPISTLLQLSVITSTFGIRDELPSKQGTHNYKHMETRNCSCNDRRWSTQNTVVITKLCSLSKGWTNSRGKKYASSWMIPLFSNDHIGWMSWNDNASLDIGTFQSKINGTFQRGICNNHNYAY